MLPSAMYRLGCERSMIGLRIAIARVDWLVVEESEGGSGADGDGSPSRAGSCRSGRPQATARGERDKVRADGHSICATARGR